MSRTAPYDDRKLLVPRRSRYRGQVLDTSSRHSIEILSDRRGWTLIDQSDTHVVVDHFFHEGKFWRASIPLDGVDTVFGQVFNFSKPKTKRGEKGPEIIRGKDGLPKRSVSILNHLQCRFKLKPGYYVELITTETSGADEPDYQLDDFVYSLEAVGPIGVRFTPSRPEHAARTAPCSR